MQVKHVFWVDAHGHWKQRSKNVVKFRMLGDLEALTVRSQNDDSLGAALVGLALLDDEVVRALDMIGSKPIGWYEVYNLIDVMGG